MKLKFLLVVTSLLLYLLHFKLDQVTKATAFFISLNNDKNETFNKKVIEKISQHSSTTTRNKIKTFINITRGGQMELENFFKFKEMQYEESRQRIR